MQLENIVKIKLQYLLNITMFNLLKNYNYIIFKVKRQILIWYDHRYILKKEI